MADKFQLKALITGVDKLSPTLDGLRKKVAGFRKGLKADGLGGGLSFGDVLKGAALVAPIAMATKAAIDFESAMADVRKVVDFDTPLQFKQMGDDIITMSKRLPMAATEIAKITAAGGQSGIDKAELGRFAEDAVKMGVAFDQSADEAGDMMAKWRTAFKLGQNEVLDLADKINFLGNTGPANARQISNIVTRIGPLGKVAGFASGQIAAMGATLAGMGVQEEIASTGIKNFMLTLASGSSATKKQQETFKALRLDARKIAVDLQKDAEGTTQRVLTAISKIDKTKQASVLENLFGRESIGAIAPMLDNLDLLKSNLKKVGDVTQYAGSMNKEYAARAATTANAIQLVKNRVVGLSIGVGNILLPSLNQFLGVIGPMIDQMADFANANPAVIKGVLGAAAGLIALRLAVVGATVAMRIFTLVSSLTPIGIAVRVLAVAAGFLIANWSAVSGFFSKLWEGIKTVTSGVWDWIKGKVLGYAPIALIANNWGAIKTFFSALWGAIKSVTSLAWEWIKGAVLGYAPLALIIRNWEPLKTFFSSLWEAVKAVTGLAWDWIKDIFMNYHPLGIIIQNWEPIVDWFKGLWDRVKVYIEPILNGAKWVGEKIGSVAGAVTSGASETVNAGAAKGLASGTSVLNSFTASVNEQRASNAVKGDIAVRFEGAPPGTSIVTAKTNNPNVSVSSKVGYSSNSRKGAPA